MTFKIRILIFKIRIRSTIIWWSSENAYVKHPKLLGTWKLPNKYQFSFLTYWWPIQPNILKPRGNLNWKCIYLMFQVCVYWYMCLPVRERRGETRVESGFLREICSFLLLHEFSERRWNVGSRTHRTGPQSLGSTANPWWYILHMARKWQEWDKILLVPLYLNFLQFLSWLKISFPPPSGILPLTLTM